ncbi:adenylyl-sulfate kinase 3 isoform X1 [Benincasa hispida]|uniref:adenylyl-sulfate kinase 3 isoform X1 n=1 Tax=Benincasa hispida TaxID=102211 RepID=UPI001901EBA7|nr:adenylyl-sulfate kinase 3 isoform X1 [Benincasa hispida]
MVTLQSARPLIRMYEYRSLGRLKPANVAVNIAIGLERSCGGWGFCCDAAATSFLQPFKAATSNCSAIHGKGCHETSTGGKSTNIVWHDCPIGKPQREKLTQQKGCVIWITGLSGSGKSTLACALSQGLHSRRKLTYILDGDNIRHGLNSDLSFEPEDRTENIRRIGEVASLFADAGIICIASLISPFRKDRDACRALLAEGDFIEGIRVLDVDGGQYLHCWHYASVILLQVFLDVPLNVCEARDPKGLYKLSRAGKIQGFTGIDDPYEEPLNSEIVLQYKEGICSSPKDMAERVISYLEERGYLQA